MKHFSGGLLVACLVGCGVSEVDLSSTAELQGGRATSSFPAVGMLITEGGAMCTGSLIGPRLVVTAAHCVEDRVAAFYLGRGAEVHANQYVDEALDGMDAFSVEDQRGHPSYDPRSCGGTPDVALVLLGEPVAGVRPMTVTRTGYPAVGSTCTVVGFGAHGSGRSETSARKRSGTSTIVGVGNSNVIVRASSAVADHGDSGGPLICNGKIRGVTSCGDDGPWRDREVAYARMEPVHAWMDQVKHGWGL